MPATITLSLRHLLVTATALAAVLGSYGVGSARAESPVAAEAVGARSPASGGDSAIFVRGTGTATGIPDQLRFSLSTHATEADVSGALAQASGTTRRVLDALGDLGLPRADVQTTGLSLRPVFDYSGDGPPQITGYAAAQDLSVLVRKLPKAGEALAATVQAGGNAVRIGGISLQIAHPHALLHRAREHAFAQARSKAEQYAAASGRRLGDVVSVREGTTGGHPVAIPSAVALRADDFGTVPVRRGSEQVSVSVSVTWAFA